LAAGAVKREHELAAQPFPKRVLSDQALELACEGRMAANCEICVDPLLERCEAGFGKARNGRLGEVLVGQVGEGWAAPDSERLSQEGGALTGVILARGLLDEALEVLAVELALANVQDVAGGLGGQDTVGAGPRLQRLAKLGDEHMHRLRPGLRRLRPPQVVQQPVGRDDLVRM
jgi:hypothetical protein